MNIDKQGNAFIYRNRDGSQGGEITFTPQGNDIIVADHTYVDPSLRGQGIAGKLLDALAEHARSENLKIKAQCSYVVSAFARNNRYQDVNADA